MNNCQKCNAPLESTERFCKACGSPVDMDAPVGDFVSTQAKPKSSKAPMIIAAVSVIIAIALAVVLVLVLAKKEEEKPAEAARNGGATATVVKEQNARASVTSNIGYRLSMPSDIMFEDAVGSAGTMATFTGPEDSWLSAMAVFPNSFDTMKKNKKVIKSTMDAYGYNINSAEVTTHGGTEMIILELENVGEEFYIAYAKASAKETFGVEIHFSNEEADGSVLDIMGEIIASAKPATSTQKGLILNNSSMGAIAGAIENADASGEEEE